MISRDLLLWTVSILIALVLASKQLTAFVGTLIGGRLRQKTSARREAILAAVTREDEEHALRERVSPKSEDGDWEKVEGYAAGSVANGEKADHDWEGVVGFFHPFCNAGGGGERVLWAAIKATQRRWPKAVCIVYTEGGASSKSTILERVENTFNLQLHHPTIIFVYLSIDARYWLLDTPWRHMTLLSQSLGSVVVAYDAFSLLVPDIFIDTIGSSFTLAFCKALFPRVPTGAYVHYPTISTDMLQDLDASAGQGINAGKGKGLRGFVKRNYWRAFAYMYKKAGSDVDVVMTNSSWTQAHIKSLWGPSRNKRRKPQEIKVVCPPVAVEDVIKATDIGGPSSKPREKILLCVAQFRPEKNHERILRAYAHMLHSPSQDPSIKEAVHGAKLVMAGSARKDSDDAKLVYNLKLLAHELKIKDSVEFKTKGANGEDFVPWPEILDLLRKSWVGVNGMWNEHFGMGVVECQAAGLICVVNDSGGPKADIVIDYDGGPTGFHASTVEEYAARFTDALSLDSHAVIAMRKRARESSRRFTDSAFAAEWVSQMGKLISLALEN